MDGVCVNEFFVFRPRGCNLRADYLERLLCSKPIIDAINSSTFGAKMPRADWQFVGNMQIPFPPLPEQQAIVRFLEYVDRRIRRYIRTKQKLIKLLNEQKQVIIHRAVTRGLDPNVRLKPSGVPWLGDIPEHWKIKKLKFTVSFLGGGTPSKSVASFWSGDIPWVSPKDMKSDVISDATDHITEEAVAASSTKIIEPGTVLIVVRSGILRHSIPVAINSNRVAINQDMKALRPRLDLSAEYLRALIEGNQKALILEWTKQGATVESIEYELMANSRIPLPPLAEQYAIVRYINDATAKFDWVISAIRREIELLREYRTRLVADVVTGKLDVRGVEVPALEEEEEEGEEEPVEEMEEE
ncbi:MAG: restriction endonuclease subunit S [Bacillota bacterium]